MIFDRTISDVERAIAIRAQKLQNGKSLSDSEIETLERGMLTINTINRIEQKQKDLYEQIISMLYLNGNVETKEWDNGEIFYSEDLQRLVKNLEQLRKMYFVYNNTPENPAASYKYTALNDIEKILYDIEQYIINMRLNYKYCGGYFCGE